MIFLLKAPNSIKRTLKENQCRPEQTTEEQWGMHSQQLSRVSVNQEQGHQGILITRGHQQDIDFMAINSYWRII